MRFRIFLLQARSEQREKRSYLFSNKFQDKVGARRGKFKPIQPGISGRIISKQSRIKERLDLTRHTWSFSTVFLQGWSNEKMDPTHSTRSFKIVILQARSEQLEKSSDPLYQVFQACFTQGKIGSRRRRSNQSNTWSFRAAFLHARSQQRETRSNMFNQEFQNFFLLQARSEQLEKKFNPLYQEFRDCFAPGKVGATREVIWT